MCLPYKSCDSAVIFLICVVYFEWTCLHFFVYVKFGVFL